MSKKPKFAAGVCELDWAWLEKELEEYRSQLPESLHNDAGLLNWVEDGNSPYTNPWGLIDPATGEETDYFTGYCQNIKNQTIRNIDVMNRFRSYEDLLDIASRILLHLRLKLTA